LAREGRVKEKTTTDYCGTWIQSCFPSLKWNDGNLQHAETRDAEQEMEAQEFFLELPAELSQAGEDFPPLINSFLFITFFL